MREINGTKVLFHNIETNGIGYVRLMFDISNVPKELFAYAGILKNILGFVNTKSYDYGALYNEINIHTGDISSYVNIYIDANNFEDYQLSFEVRDL